MADDGEPDGTAADDDRDVTLADLAASHRMQGDGHRFGQTRRGPQTVRWARRTSWPPRRGPVRRSHRVPGATARSGAPRRWPRTSGNDTTSVPTLNSFAAPRPRSATSPLNSWPMTTGVSPRMKSLVSDRGHDVFEFARMMPGVQIRTADATAPHVEYELSLLWLRGRYVDDLEVSVETGDRLHRATPMDSMRRNASAVRSFSVAYPSMPMMRSASASRDRSTCTTPSTPPSAMP